MAMENINNKAEAAPSNQAHVLITQQENGVESLRRAKIYAIAMKIAELLELDKKYIAVTSVGTYKWNVNSEAQPCIDEVLILKDDKWESTGKSLKEFENNTFKGVWFYVGNGGSDEGMTRYKLIADGYTNTGYQIDGADGYLNCRDYVIWLGGRWVRFNVYEAKASTVKNTDGQYSPKSGACGLMSSTDKAYLTDLVNRFTASNQKNAYNSGNDCAESGLYGHINLGRPSGSELFNLISIKDKNNNSTSQLAIGQDSGGLWTRGKVSGNWIKFLTEEFFNASWGKRYIPVFHCKDSNNPEGWLVDWCRDTGIYIGGLKKDCGGHPPVLNDNHTSWAVLVLNGMNTDSEAVNCNHRIQIAFDVVNSRIYMRRGWMSENTWADSWTDVGKIVDGYIVTSMLSNLCVTESKIATGAVTTEKYANKSVTMAKLSEALQSIINGHTNAIGTLADLNTASKDNIVEAVNEVKAEAGTAVKIRGSLSSRIVSEDPNYNGYDFDSIPNVKPGDAFTVSADIATWWGSANPPKAGDMIISIGDNSANASNWLIMRGTGATAALESRISALERQLNGISFGVDTNGNLTYETQGEVTE